MADVPFSRKAMRCMAFLHTRSDTHGNDKYMEKWTVFAKKDDFVQIGQKFGIDPVIARIIRNRDIIGDEAIDEYLNGGLERLRDPFSLKDMDRAAAILKEKISLGKKIRIIGDYDIDGIMASYILKRGIDELGGNADIRVPNRISDGYGINESMIDEAARCGIDTILTCDNGIAALMPVKKAKELGLTVVITDHHEVLSVPEADAVVDPKRPDDSSENKNLCGASVAWKLIRALGGDADYDLLQYAAFATIGDIMELTGENRIIVKEGIRRLRDTNNIGLRALAEECSVNINTLNTYHIGFLIGPCLNASGRLDTAERALKLLESDNEMTAKEHAAELRALNESRKAMTETGVRVAEEEIIKEDLMRDHVLVVFLPEVHESIAGIIAGRIREKYNRPVFILTRGESCVKGSGRSIEAYSMFEELVRAGDLLLKYGGHPMAAGLSLEEENIEKLRKRLNENETLKEEDLVSKVRIDVPMPVSYVTEELIAQLELLEPFGKGNEKPVFADRNVFCEHTRIFGAKRNLLKTRIRSLAVPGDSDPERPGFQAALRGPEFDAISFRDPDVLAERISENPELQIVYEPQINEYMGQRRIQILIHHYR